jgi:hypothetical protein
MAHADPQNAGRPARNVAGEFDRVAVSLMLSSSNRLLHVIPQAGNTSSSSLRGALAGLEWFAAQCNLREMAHPTMFYSSLTTLSPIEPFQLQSEVAPAGAVTIQRTNATTLMIASLSLVIGSGRRPVHQLDRHAATQPLWVTWR